MITYRMHVPHKTLMRTYKAIDVVVVKCQRSDLLYLLGLNLIDHVSP